MERLALGDLILIGEAVTDLSADELLATTNLPLLESALEAPFASFDGVEFYPQLDTRAAILCSRIVRNHALVDGNKRVGLAAMLTFLALNDHKVEADQDDLGDVIEALAAGDLAEADFVAWVEQRVTLL